MTRVIPGASGTRVWWLLAFAVAALVAAPTVLQAQETAGEKKAEDKGPDLKAKDWVKLFDGKTLDGWKSTKFGGEGKVEVKDGMIVMETGSDMTGITFAGKKGFTLPKNDYELTWEGQRLAGSDFFATMTFPVGDEYCSFVTGGWGGTVAGISCVDWYDASDNPTTNFVNFKDKTWYRFRVRVTDDKIQVWIDDNKTVEQDRKDHKFSTRIEVDLNKPLGVATWCTSGAVRDIRIRTIKPDKKKAPPKEKE